MTTQAVAANVQPIPLSPGNRRLILCFDGTWNSLESQTNVLRLFRSIATVETACNEQLAFYDEGVGTEHRNRVRGGFRGRGLIDNVLEGYCWLVNNYIPGEQAPDRLDHVEGDLTDEQRNELFSHGDVIFLTGFSRGAYTARSLAGLINRVGIIRRDQTELSEGEAVTRDTPLIQEAWKLYQDKGEGREVPLRYQPKTIAFRERNSHNVKIGCVAVWDTVGAMGLPHSAGPFFDFTRRKFAFLDTCLCRTIEHAYHALAIDEHRVDFEATLWTAPKDGVNWARDVEQRWFPGSHANVGGGYDDDLLCEAPLFWLAQRLATLGVHFRRDRDRPPYKAEPPPEFRPDGNEYMSPLRDSYRVFVSGFYPWLLKLVGRGRRRRRMMVKADGIAQVIDPSARLKWDLDPDYRPINLAMAGRTDAAPPEITLADLQIAQGSAAAAGKRRR